MNFISTLISRWISYKRTRNVARRTLAIVIGPESSGTRVFTEILSQHQQVDGTTDARDHGDILDESWRRLSLNDIQGAKECFPATSEAPYVLTRRSMPHAVRQGAPAEYMEFAHLPNIYRMCRIMDFDILMLITCRSTAANLASWTTSRASAGGSIHKAIAQYHASYVSLFTFISQYTVPFFFLSLEALLLDKQAYVNSIFELMGLPHHKVEVQFNQAVNARHYTWYQKDRTQLQPTALKNLFDELPPTSNTETHTDRGYMYHLKEDK